MRPGDGDERPVSDAELISETDGGGELAGADVFGGPLLDLGEPVEERGATEVLPVFRLVASKPERFRGGGIIRSESEAACLGEIGEGEGGETWRRGDRETLRLGEVVLLTFFEEGFEEGELVEVRRGDIGLVKREEERLAIVIPWMENAIVPALTEELGGERWRVHDLNDSKAVFRS